MNTAGIARGTLPLAVALRTAGTGAKKTAGIPRFTLPVARHVAAAALAVKKV